MGARSYKAGSEDEVLGVGRLTICRLNIPFPLCRIELSSNNDSIESTVLLHTNYLVDVVEVSTQVFVVGVVVGPVPCVVYFGPIELVLRNFGVDSGAGVAVPAPGATRIIAGLENDCLQTAIAEGLEHEDTGYLISWWMKSVRDGDLPKPAPTIKASTSRFLAYGPVLSAWTAEKSVSSVLYFLGRGTVSPMLPIVIEDRNDQVLQLLGYSSQKIDSLGCHADFFFFFFGSRASIYTSFDAIPAQLLRVASALSSIILSA